MFEGNETQAKVVREMADNLLSNLLTKYSSTNVPQEVSFRDLCKEWAWAKRSDKYTHFIHRYPAKLLPYIPIFFLSTSLVGTDETILDSFSGSGTVGLESIVHRHHPRNALLNEINPLGRLISSVKVTPIEPKLLKREVDDFLQYLKAQSEPVNEPDFPGVDFWFRPAAKKDLARIKAAISGYETSVAIKDLFMVSFSSIIRDMSRADPRIGPPVVLSSRKFKGELKEEIQAYLTKKSRFKADVLFRRHLRQNVQRLSDLWLALGEGDIQVQGRVSGADARELKRTEYLGLGKIDLNASSRMKDESIGMVISSPPYVSAQKYGRTTKLEMWWLGLIENTSEDFARIDRETIGTERISLAQEIQATGNEEADSLIERLVKANKKKESRILSEYYKDMSLSLREMYRVLRWGGYCVLVIGNNTIAGNQIPNNSILADLAESEGFCLRTVLVDEIRSRGMITKRHATGGMISDEWILLLEKPAIKGDQAICIK